MDEAQQRTCHTCDYFRQHYVWMQGYFPIDVGHCVHPPRNRRCRPSLAACDRWKPQSRHYQSNRLPPE